MNKFRIDKKIITRLKRIEVLKTKINELDNDCEYPYKTGAMERTNKAIDLWTMTTRHKNKLLTLYRRLSCLALEIDELIKANYITENNFNKLCQDNKFYFESEIFNH